MRLRAELELGSLDSDAPGRVIGYKVKDLLMDVLRDSDANDIAKMVPSLTRQMDAYTKGTPPIWALFVGRSTKTTDLLIDHPEFKDAMKRLVRDFDEACDIVLDVIPSSADKVARAVVEEMKTVVHYGGPGGLRRGWEPDPSPS